jgi:hypothetical protein
MQEYTIHVHSEINEASGSIEILVMYTLQPRVPLKTLK